MKTQKTNKLIGGLLLALMALAPLTVNAQRRGFQPRQNVPLDSIVMSDPAVLADSATQMYYMTGTGGMMWKSKDLKLWDGPYRVAETDPTSWMGPRPMIWAAEFHKYKDKYYYFATFTNREVKIDTVKGNVIERRASHVLVSDKAEGPYKPMADPMYLPADKPTLDGTFWVDTNGKPYLVYCYEWLQNWDGTIEYIQLKDDLSGTVGEATLMFKSSTCLLWTSWIDNIYTQGVAYSESGTLAGPWVHEPKPITPPNYGHSMLFRTLDGRWLMSVHSHLNVNGRYIRHPHFFNVDFTGDKLVLGEEYKP